MPSDSNQAGFSSLPLNPALLKALGNLGYEVPTQIQQQTIPPLLDGKDVIGQAQTGTGKTAAFALPLLSNLDLKQKSPQVLVLTPTRELAIQVAEAFQSYAAMMKGFHVLPVYGGQEYGTQLRALDRGVHVIVGTPGRVMDHMRRGKINLESLNTLVLDEADEMLRMGFIDDVEWVLEQLPEKRQIALFSATMPEEIKKITHRYLHEPVEISVKQQSATADTIRQRYWAVTGPNKLDALTRILEAEVFEAIIVFVRTKTATIEVAEKLEARGYRSSALNGDIAQKQRERIVNQLKSGKIDIVVATDVAARGLDVERISHVINFDIPHDTEAYVHRIGRTGRAGRNGEAILFVTPRERRMLQSIQRATNTSIERLELPSVDMVNSRRIDNFKQRISNTINEQDLALFKELIGQYRDEQGIELLDVAAALAKMVQGRTPFLLSERDFSQPAFAEGESSSRKDKRSKAKSGDEGRGDERRKSPRRDKKESEPLETGMDRFRIEVGHDHQVKPANIVGAIANEADIDSKYIGRINIFDDHSLVDLPEGMPKELLHHLKKVRVQGQQLRMTLVSGKSGKKAGGEEKSKAKRAKPKTRQRDTRQKGKPKRARGKQAN